jgi:hypothetical protein
MVTAFIAFPGHMCSNAATVASKKYSASEFEKKTKKKCFLHYGTIEQIIPRSM